MILLLLLIKTQTEFNRDCTEITPYFKTNKEGSVSGTFCPTSTVSSVHFHGYTDSLKYSIKKHDGNTYEQSKSNSNLFSCTDLSDTFTHTFYQGRCYPFHLESTEECTGEYDWMGLYTNSNHNAYVSKAYSCSTYDDCIPLHYKSDCSGSIKKQPGSGECSVSLGKNGDGACSCGSATSIQEDCRSGTSGSNFQYWWRNEQNNGWTYKGTLNSISIAAEDHFYEQYWIEGYIVLPNKDTSYSFYLSSGSPATLKIDTKTGGSLNYLDCSPSDSHDVEIVYGKPAKVGAYKVIIQVDTGCSLNDFNVILKWKKNNGNYEIIPSMYLFH